MFDDAAVSNSKGKPRDQLDCFTYTTTGRVRRAYIMDNEVPFGPTATRNRRPPAPTAVMAVIELSYNIARPPVRSFSVANGGRGAANSNRTRSNGYSILVSSHGGGVQIDRAYCVRNRTYVRKLPRRRL